MNGFFVERRSCPVCDGRDLVRLRDVAYTEPPLRDHLASYYAPVGPGVDFRFLEGARYILEECRSCGLIYQRQVPGPELEHELYGRWLDPEVLRGTYRRSRKARYFHWLATETTRMLEFFERPPAEITFLDFGMGRGHWCMLARSFGCDVSGTDIAATQSEDARRFGVAFIPIDALPAQAFDIINAEQVFEHLVAPSEILARLASALKPGGLIRINVPLGFDAKRRIAAWDWRAREGSANDLNVVAPLQHINCYVYATLQRLGEHVGLSPVSLPPLAGPVSSIHRARAASRRAVARVGLSTERVGAALRRFGLLGPDTSSSIFLTRE